MVSSSLQDRMAAFENGSVSSKQNNDDMTGISNKSPKASKVHTSVKHPWSDKRPARVDATGNIGAGDDESEETPKDVKVHTSVKHPWSEKKGTGRVSISEGDVEAQNEPRRGGRPSLKDSAFENISRRRLMAEAAAKSNPMSMKNRALQIAKCAGMSILIAGFIIAASITIVTGWGDGTIETGFRYQGAVPGKLLSMSENGRVAILEDDFGFKQVYNFDENSSPMWNTVGPSFRSRGRVELSRDGSLLAYTDFTTARLRFVKYNRVQRDWIQQEDTPFLIGDDLAISPDLDLITIGSYGLGSITNFNSKVGEGSITTYKYDGMNLTVHGRPLMKLFGLQSFEVSPDGKGLVTVAENSGIITLNGYVSFKDVNDTYAWTKSPVTIELNSTYADLSVANGIYAVAFESNVQVYSYSGRPWGKEISAPAGANITSVALTSDGRRLAVGSMNSDFVGAVQWYEYPEGQDTNGDWADMKTILEAPNNETLYFGSGLDLNERASQLAVQSGMVGEENVHFYDVTFRAARKV